MMKTHEYAGKILKEEREKLNLTLEQVWHGTNISISTLSRIEAGGAWDTRKVTKLCHFYKIEPCLTLYPASTLLSAVLTQDIMDHNCQQMILNLAEAIRNKQQQPQ